MLLWNDFVHQNTAKNLSNRLTVWLNQVVFIGTDFYSSISWILCRCELFFSSAWCENLSKINSLIKSSCCHQNRLIHAFTKYCLYLQWMRHFFLRSFLYPVIISHSIMSDQCFWLIFCFSLSRFCTVGQKNFHKNLAENTPHVSVSIFFIWYSSQTVPDPSIQTHWWNETDL